MKAFLKVLVCLAALAFSVSALAADKTIITVAKGGIRIMTTNPAEVGAPPAKVASGDNGPEAGTAIYNNFAFDYRKAIYWCCYGGLLAGPNSPYGQQHGTPVFQATAFTPSSNMTVTAVKLGLSWQSGTFTDLIVSINADNSGRPGDVLATWKGKKLPVFGTCCVIKSHGVPNGGVSVTAGTQYWIVVSTEADSDIQGAWGFDVLDQIDAIPNAYYYQGVWYPFAAVMNFSFAVYGK